MFNIIVLLKIVIPFSIYNHIGKSEKDFPQLVKTCFFFTHNVVVRVLQITLRNYGKKSKQSKLTEAIPNRSPHFPFCFVCFFFLCYTETK